MRLGKKPQRTAPYQSSPRRESPYTIKRTSSSRAKAPRYSSEPETAAAATESHWYNSKDSGSRPPNLATLSAGHCSQPIMYKITTQSRLKLRKVTWIKPEKMCAQPRPNHLRRHTTINSCVVRKSAMYTPTSTTSVEPSSLTKQGSFQHAPDLATNTSWSWWKPTAAAYLLSPCPASRIPKWYERTKSWCNASSKPTSNRASTCWTTKSQPTWRNSYEMSTTWR